MPIELNGAGEEVVGPIREALMSAQKARTVRFPAAESPPGSSELPPLEGAGGKLLSVKASEDGLEFKDPVDAFPAAFTPMRKAGIEHSNLVGSVLEVDLSSVSPGWDGTPPASRSSLRTLDLIIAAQDQGSASTKFLLYRAMIFLREDGGTWYRLSQQVIVNVSDADPTLGAWEVGDYTPNPESPSGTISITHDSPSVEHTCMLQYAYSYH